MDLEPGQPVFVKEVNGNIWRTATVDQPAAEPNSYWVRFPDNSILRRTRSMIKPRSLPSHFELQAEAQPGNFEGKTYSHSFDSFNQLNGQSMLPVTPMVSVTTPATIDRGSKVSGNNRSYQFHRGTPASSGRSQCSFNTKTFYQIHQRCTSRSLHPFQEMNGLVDVLCVQVFQWIGLLVLSLSCNVWTCETWNYVEYSSPLVYSKFYSSDT